MCLHLLQKWNSTRAFLAGVELNRARNSPVQQIRSDACDDPGQVPQSLLITSGRLEGEFHQGCGNIHEPANKGHNGAHLCAVVG